MYHVRGGKGREIDYPPPTATRSFPLSSLLHKPSQDSRLTSCISPSDILHMLSENKR